MEYHSLADSGMRQERAAIIYQQNPINMICQQGANNHISISESEAIQIGHGNTMLRQIACAQRGKRRGLAGAPVVPKWGKKVRKEAWLFSEAWSTPHLESLCFPSVCEREQFSSLLPRSQQDVVGGKLPFSLSNSCHEKMGSSRTQ